MTLPASLITILREQLRHYHDYIANNHLNNLEIKYTNFCSIFVSKKKISLKNRLIKGKKNQFQSVKVHSCIHLTKTPNTTRTAAPTTTAIAVKRATMTM